jgi:hypothetical protein
VTLADHFANELKRPAKQGDIVRLGPIALLAHAVKDSRVTTIGLRLSDPDEKTVSAKSMARSLAQRARKYILDRP